MRTLAVLCLVGGLTAGLLLCGCGGGGDVDVVVPPAGFVGTWGGVGLDGNGNPRGDAVFEVQPDGDIVMADIGGASLAGSITTAAAGQVIGHVTSLDGAIRIDFTDPKMGHVTGTGDLDLNDTGHATGTAGGKAFNLTLWRANWHTARTLNVTVQGAPVGTVSVDADGIVTGTFTIEGQVTPVRVGVVTGAGHIAITFWCNDVGDAGGTVFVEGDMNINGATGTWKDETGDSGTWTAVFA